MSTWYTTAHLDFVFVLRSASKAYKCGITIVWTSTSSVKHNCGYRLLRPTLDCDWPCIHFSHFYLIANHLTPLISIPYFPIFLLHPHMPQRATSQPSARVPNIRQTNNPTSRLTSAHTTISIRCRLRHSQVQMIQSMTWSASHHLIVTTEHSGHITPVPMLIAGIVPVSCSAAGVRLLRIKYVLNHFDFPF